MMRPPEEVFDDFFQKRDAEDRAHYRGRKDLNAVPEPMRSFLIDLRESVNRALLNAQNQNPLFFFDFIESDVSNALAFRHEGYSFIGVTFPLLDEIVATCRKLVLSPEIVSILSPSEITVAYNLRKLAAVLIRIQLLFAESHEYVHHRNGHLTRGQESFLNEVVDAGEAGSLDRQACEVDADGGAVFFVLADLLDGTSRPSTIAALDLDTAPINIQDEALLACLIVAASGFFFIRQPVVLDNIREAYRLTHPPQAVRMMSVISFAAAWCQQFHPGLESLVMEEGWGIRVMSAMAEATWGNNRENGWEAQVKLIFSESSAEYFREIQERAGRLSGWSPQQQAPPAEGPEIQGLRLTLLPAPSDDLKNPDYQLGVAGFAVALRTRGLEIFPPISLREVVGLDVPTTLGGFDIKVALGVAAPLCTALGVWLQARYGRKVRLKVGEKEVEAEAPTIEQIEELLELAKAFKERTSIEQIAPPDDQT
jgi:hypothetical protein